MADIIDSSNQHLFLEENIVENESFIANVNKAVQELDVIKNFNDALGNVGLRDLVDAILDTIENEYNKWSQALAELGATIDSTKSIFNASYNYTATTTYDGTIGTPIVLPSTMQYLIGRHMLLVCHNGTVCYEGQQYREVLDTYLEGSVGDRSHTIMITMPINKGDEFNIRVLSLSNESLQEAILNYIQDTLTENVYVTVEGTTVPRQLNDRFADIINVKDFGAKGNGIDDDTTAFTLAIQQAQKLGDNCCLFIPVGIYKVTELPNVPCYGPGSVLYNSHTYSPFELLFRIGHPIVKDTTGRFMLDYSVMSVAERTALLKQILPSIGGAIKVDSNGKFVIDLSNMLLAEFKILTSFLIPSAGGGIVLDANGKLTLDPSNMTNTELKEFVDSLLPATGGGLTTDSTGKLIIDLDQMNKTQLEEFIRSILPTSDGILTTDENGKLKVDFTNATADELQSLISSIIKTGGGLAVDNTGKLYVDFNLVPDEQMQDIVLSMVQTGGGLSVDDQGKLYVDFNSMPTDKFEAMLKSIRVPIWLTANKNFYVNQATGSDTLDEGRGESSDKPFKTIQACVNYVCDNYNMSSFCAKINIADGIYPERISLPSYSSGTGYVEIVGNNENKEAVVVRGIFNRFASLFALTSFTAKETLAFNAYSAIVQATAGTLNFQNFEIDCTGVPEDSATFSGLWVRNAAVAYVVGANSMTPPTGLTVKIDASRKVVSAVAASSGGTVTFNADFFLEGDSPQNFTPINLQSLSVSSFVDSSTNYPGRDPQVTATGTISGPRYRVNGNSVLDTRGGGPEFLPGSTNGATSTGGQYL